MHATSTPPIAGASPTWSAFGITDLALCVSTPDLSYCFPGPRPIPDDFVDTCNILRERCVTKRNESRVQQMHRVVEMTEFTVSHNNVVWRVHYDANAIDGDWIRMRRMPQEAPHLGRGGLPSSLPAPIVNTLLHPDLRAGGLVFVVGGTGQGKTHTATATVRSRLQMYGGMAFTIEDPPEHPLNGWHEGQNGVRGICAQHQVLPQPDGSDGWASAMRGALRSQPSGTPSMMFVGEIRTQAAAEVAMQAAGNGFLVLATGFATDVPSGVEHLLKQLGAHRANILAYLLRVVLYQRLVDSPSRSGSGEKVVQVQVAVSPSGNSRVATIIAGGQLARLQDEAQRQLNIVRADQDLWAGCQAG